MADALALTGKLVAAYLRNNPLAIDEVAEHLRATHASLLATAEPAAEPAGVPQASAVALKKSVTPDAIFCLECGRGAKMLKRHLATAHGLTVEDYRAKWSLPSDYPVVAPNYAQRRSQLALENGLGRKTAAVAPMEGEPTTATPASSGHRYPPSRWSKPEK
jgi:predicted transcriptional regulator